jgi:hypothetical protein
MVCDLNHRLAAFEPSVGRECEFVAAVGPRVTVHRFWGPSVSDFGCQVTQSGCGTTVTECFRFCSSGQTMVHTSEKAFNWTSDLHATLTRAHLPQSRLTGADTAKRCFRNGQTMVQVTWCKGGTGEAEAAKLLGARIGPKQCPRICAAEKGRPTELRTSTW